MQSDDLLNSFDCDIGSWRVCCNKGLFADLQFHFTSIYRQDGFLTVLVKQSDHLI